VPYLWLACGSQGRQEQTGVSDQDNCLILDDAATPADDAYFAAGEIRLRRAGRGGVFLLPRRHDGDGDPLAAAGARLARLFRQGWIAKPSPEAQMLASVMFDLRPIGGHFSLFADLQEETLAAASKNSIFVAHMVSNSLKHQPPLGLFRGFATVRSGEHKNTIDLKHNGVVPVTDLGRVYALKGRLTEVNTRARLLAAIEAGSVSAGGGRDLIDAYDMIAQTRLEHQAAQIQRGEKPDNFMAPSDLSDFERSHLRDAFVVIKTMQNAAGSSGGGYLN
jgi:CBS domain-containing protein